MNTKQLNEIEYLSANPDVAAAVAAGQFRSGLDHYERCGKREGRPIYGSDRGRLNRAHKILFAVDKKGIGLEIGPSHRPIAPKKLGYKVDIVDHLDADGLRKKYAKGNANIENIEDVDFVWNGQPLPDLIGKTACYDWIIASHVIEHVPDLISFLQQSETLLKPSGVLSLAIPDKRYCFDHFNPISTTGQFLDAFYEKRTRPSAGQIFDHFSNATKLNGRVSWSQSTAGSYALIHTFQQAQNKLERARNSSDYIDVHCWRFTPESFRMVLSDFNMLGLIKMGIVDEFDSEGCEFFMTLGKNGTELETKDRLEALQRLVEL